MLTYDKWSPISTNLEQISFPSTPPSLPSAQQQFLGQSRDDQGGQGAHGRIATELQRLHLGPDAALPHDVDEALSAVAMLLAEQEEHNENVAQQLDGQSDAQQITDGVQGTALDEVVQETAAQMQRDADQSPTGSDSHLELWLQLAGTLHDLLEQAQLDEVLQLDATIVDDDAQELQHQNAILGAGAHDQTVYMQQNALGEAEVQLPGAILHAHVGQYEDYLALHLRQWAEHMAYHAAQQL